jgi:pimeloyl-ACP methyl ester carboxylesterase
VGRCLGRGGGRLLRALRCASASRRTHGLRGARPNHWLRASIQKLISELTAVRARGSGCVVAAALRSRPQPRPDVAPLSEGDVRGPGGGGAARAVAPIEGIRHIRAPLLLIAGDQDRHTLLSESQRLFDAAPEPKDLWVLPGAAHVNFHRFDPTEYERRVLEFLARALGDGATRSAPAQARTTPRSRPIESGGVRRRARPQRSAPSGRDGGRLRRAAVTPQPSLSH